MTNKKEQDAENPGDPFGYLKGHLTEGRHVLLFASVLYFWIFFVIGPIATQSGNAGLPPQSTLDVLPILFFALLAAAVAGFYFDHAERANLTGVDKIREQLIGPDRLKVTIAAHLVAFLAAHLFILPGTIAALMQIFPLNLILLGLFVSPVVFVAMRMNVIRQFAALQAFQKDFYFPLRYEQPTRNFPDKTVYLRGTVKLLHDPDIGDRLIPFIKSQIVKTGAANPGMYVYGTFDQLMKNALIAEFGSKVHQVAVDLSEVRETYWREKSSSHAGDFVVIGEEA